MPEGEKIALFGETRGFYLDRDYMWADPGHNAIIPYARFGSDSDELLDWLKSHGIDYILVNYGNYPADDGTLIRRAVSNSGLVELSSTGLISIYRIEK
jgi:hypothetical protein